VVLFIRGQVVVVPVDLAELLLLGLQVQLVALVELELVQILLGHRIQ
jgi:membrane protein implicated in regulation of membrane protease activity